MILTTRKYLNDETLILDVSECFGVPSHLPDLFIIAPLISIGEELPKLSLSHHLRPRFVTDMLKKNGWTRKSRSTSLAFQNWKKTGHGSSSESEAEWIQPTAAWPLPDCLRANFVWSLLEAFFKPCSKWPHLCTVLALPSVYLVLSFSSWFCFVWFRINRQALLFLQSHGPWNQWC